jgi:hypothetical protein
MKKMIRYASLLALLTTAHLTFADDTVTILRAGLWHGDEVTVESGPDWWGIFPEGDGFTLQQSPVTITAEFDAIIDEEGQATGKMVKVPQEAEPVLLLHGIKGLKEGRLSTTKRRIPENMVDPGQSIDLDLIGDESHVSTRLEITGSMIGQSDRLPEDFEFTLVRISGSGTERQSLAKLPGISDGQPRLVWVGDLDHDQKIDLLIDATDNYNVTHLILYLSSAAKEGELVGKVAEWRTVGC